MFLLRYLRFVFAPCLPDSEHLKSSIYETAEAGDLEREQELEEANQAILLLLKNLCLNQNSSKVKILFFCQI